MKYLFLSLAFLLILGVGCTNTNTAQTTNSDDVQVEFEAVGNTEEEIPEGVEIVDIILDGDTSTPLSDTENIQEQFNEPDQTVVVSMESGNFYFEPNSITAPAGADVIISFSSNTGFHTFVIDEIGLKETVVGGESIGFQAPETPGTYVFYCDIGSHRTFGMEGTLIVE